MNKQVGFSLLEVIVAFSILAISLAILLNIFSSGVRTAGIAEEYIIATQIAESLMAKTGVESPLVIGQSSGVVADKYHWFIKIMSAPNLIAQKKTGFDLFKVQIIVHWGKTESNSRQIELNTVRMGTKQ